MEGGSGVHTVHQFLLFGGRQAGLQGLACMHPCLHSYPQVCPWTLFLTMSLTLLKGLMPHVPAMLPLLVSDPEMRSRAEATFMDPEFQENIEQYFVENIKVGHERKWRKMECVL